MAPVDDELHARLEAWAAISPLSDSGALSAASVNALRDSGLRLFYGGRGIWTDKARTSSLGPDGVTVGVLHTGRSYADDLLPGGIVYHYPHTEAQGRDAQEVNATKAAKHLGLPLFVIVQADSTSRRVAHLGWVEDWDDEGELFLITFGESPPTPAPSQQEEDDAPFILERSGPPGKKTSTPSRPGQHRFSFLVFRRYGAQCAVCDVSVMALLDAAHLRAYREGGSNDARNGVVLCATHHRAFDKAMFGIDPATLQVVYREGAPDGQQLGITRTSIAHLRARPHSEALEWCWSKFHPTG